MTTKLYRSESERMIAGVCGGLAHYLNINVTLVRVFFVVLALGDGAGVLIYLLLWLIMPAATAEQATLATNIRVGAMEMRDKAFGFGKEIGSAVHNREQQRKTGTIVGASLIIVGFIALIDAIEVPWLWWLDFDLLWPVLLVFGGILVLIRSLQRQT